MSTTDTAHRTKRPRSGAPPRFKSTKRKPIHHSCDTVALATHGLDFGAERKSTFLTTWNASGRCERPITVELTGRPHERSKHVHATGLDIDVRCRKCLPCLKARARLWRDRAEREFKQSPRTWFGTLTLSPASFARSLEVARVIEAAQGIDYELLDPEERRSALLSVLGKEITKYLKRVRKACGDESFRYMMVTEHHKSGVPHWHTLIHERDFATTVARRTLDGQWSLGFSQFRLAEATSARYVTKYISKCSDARIRASLHYGVSGLSSNEPTGPMDPSKGEVKCEI